MIAGGLSPFIATALLPYGRGALASYIDRDGPGHHRRRAHGVRDPTPDHRLSRLEARDRRFIGRIQPSVRLILFSSFVSACEFGFLLGFGGHRELTCVEAITTGVMMVGVRGQCGSASY